MSLYLKTVNNPKYKAHALPYFVMKLGFSYSLAKCHYRLVLDLSQLSEVLFDII